MGDSAHLDDKCIFRCFSSAFNLLTLGKGVILFLSEDREDSSGVENVTRPFPGVTGGRGWWGATGGYRTYLHFKRRCSEHVLPQNLLALTMSLFLFLKEKSKNRRKSAHTK